MAAVASNSARAQARFVRVTPQKARRVIDLIRGLPASRPTSTLPPGARADAPAANGSALDVLREHRQTILADFGEAAGHAGIGALDRGKADFAFEAEHDIAHLDVVAGKAATNKAVRADAAGRGQQGVNARQLGRSLGQL